jgi:hypothetical protein
MMTVFSALLISKDQDVMLGCKPLAIACLMSHAPCLHIVTETLQAASHTYTQYCCNAWVQQCDSLHSTQFTGFLSGVQSFVR